MPALVKTLRLMALSHAAVVEVNQEPYHALAGAGADVTLVTARALNTDIRGRVRFRALEGFAGRLVPLRTVVGGYRRGLGGQRGIHLIVYAGLARAIARAKPDVIFVEEEPFSLAARQVARAAGRLGIPFVVHENQNIERALPAPFASIRRAVLRAAAGATVRNRAAAEILRAGGFAGPIAAFPHAVDPARFAVGGAVADLPRPVIGFVGRLVAEKGIVELVEAVAQVQGELGSASLLVIGDGPLLERGRALARARGVPAMFLGALAHEEVPGRYAAMDVVAVPSRTTPTWKEQFGRIVIEANAAGVPVVVSDSGELPVTVEATGGGIVYAEGDVDALRESLIALWRDPSRRAMLAHAGKRSVAERFTPEAVARELFRFLSEVAT